MMRIHQKGMTLQELVIVLVIMGTLSAVAVPRFLSFTAFRERGFFDSALTATRYAHKLAIASGCDVKVEFDGSGFSIGQWAVCAPVGHAGGASAVSHPGGGPFTGSKPDDILVGSANFYFDKGGRPRDLGGVLLNAETDISIGSKTLRIVPETGFSYEFNP